MSVDMSIGEAIHNMNDKYYKSIQPNNFVNPLYKEEKAVRPQENPLIGEISSSDSEASDEMEFENGAPDKSNGDDEKVR